MNSYWSYSPEPPNLGQNRRCLSRVTLLFGVWPWKTIGHLFYVASSFVHHFITIGEFKLELQSGNSQFESKSTILIAVWPQNLTYDIVVACDLEIWRMTLKNNRTPLLSNIKLCASFHHHMWNQTGVTVWKRLSWVFSCDQAALWMVFSVCPSVRLSVCHTFLTMFPSSYHHEIFRSYHIGPG